MGSIEVKAGNAIRLIGGDAGGIASAYIGHGGYEADGAKSGQIDVMAGGPIEMSGLGGNYSSYTQIGHGGTRADGRRSTSTATTRTGRRAWRWCPTGWSRTRTRKARW